MNLREIKELGLNQVLKKLKKITLINKPKLACMLLIKDNSIGLLEF